MATQNYTPEQIAQLNAAIAGLNQGVDKYNAAKNSTLTHVDPITVGGAYKQSAGVDTANFKAPTPDTTDQEALANSYRSNNPVDENAIRSNTLAQFQAEIDATNQIYGQKLAEAKQQGLGRLGSTTAILGRGGNLGSPGGEATFKGVENQNSAIEASIQAERGAAIASIVEKANRSAADEIATKRAAQEKGLDSYLKYLADRGERKNSNLSKLAASLIDQNISPDQLGAQLDQIAQSYGVTKDDIVSAYSNAKATKDKADAALKVEADKTAFDQDLKNRQLALDSAYKNGTLSIDRYNAETNRLKALSDQYKAGLDASGNPIASTASDLKGQALDSANALLAKFDKGSGTSAVGGSRVFGLQILPGTAPRDFEVQFNNLKSLLSLDNVRLLKGQGQVSDAERRLLSEASAKLDLSQSEPEFRSALSDVIKALSGPGATAAGGGSDTGAPPKGADGADYGFPGYVSDGTQWVLK